MVSKTPINLYLDTEFFDARFKNRRFFDKNELIMKALAGCVATNTVQLITTDVTVSEIEEHISSWIKEITSNEFVGKLESVLTHYNLDLSKEMRKFKSNLTDMQIQDFRDWLVSMNVIICDAEISSKKILLDYFEKKQPFGQGRKKNEFPDAFIVAKLLEWAKSNEKKVHVVTGDEDMHGWCRENSSFTAHKEISQVLFLSNLDQAMTQVLSDSMKNSNILMEMVKKVVLLYRSDYEYINMVECKFGARYNGGSEGDQTLQIEDCRLMHYDEKNIYYRIFAKFKGFLLAYTIEDIYDDQKPKFGLPNPFLIYLEETMKNIFAGGSGVDMYHYDGGARNIEIDIKIDMKNFKQTENQRVTFSSEDFEKALRVAEIQIDETKIVSASNIILSPFKATFRKSAEDF